MKYPNDTWASLSEKQIEEAAKLNAKEHAAVAEFLAAARRLPRGLTIGMCEHDGILVVRKQITPGYHHNVGALKRKSLSSRHL